MSDQPVKWEQRWHPLREEWVVVAAHRQNRPWSGETLDAGKAPPPSYDPTCYLCPRNPRVSGKGNPDYQGVYVFDNDLPCVGAHAPMQPALPVDPRGIYKTVPASGVARVTCYHPRHDLTLAEMEVAQIEEVVKVWQNQYRELGSRPEVNHVLIFENKGEVVGVSNPHPHGQIYATNFVFKTIENEARVSARHLRDTGRTLLGDIIAAERTDGRRVLAENGGAIAFIPHFARYAYETFVAPKRIVPSVAELDPGEVRDFAMVLKETLVRFDNLWKMPFPYVLAHHSAPTDGADHRGFGFHLEFHPPLRKPNLLKYLAGPEIGGGSFLSDTWPEDKAAELRAVPSVHYKEKSPQIAQMTQM